MLAISNSLNAHSFPIFQPILMISVSKFMVHRAFSYKAFLSYGFLSPLNLIKFMLQWIHPRLGGQQSEVHEINLRSVIFVHFLRLKHQNITIIWISIIGWVVCVCGGGGGGGVGVSVGSGYLWLRSLCRQKLDKTYIHMYPNCRRTIGLIRVLICSHNFSSHLRCCLLLHFCSPFF